MRKYLWPVAVAGLLLAGCSAKPISTSGIIVLNSDGVTIDASGSCAGTGGYSDLREGAGVTVWDATGKIVGSGSINASLEGDRKGKSCILLWSAKEIPADAGPYQYEVAHRGRLTFTEAQAQKLSATLGDD